MDVVFYLYEVVGIIYGDLLMKNILIDKICNNYLILIDLGSVCDVVKGEFCWWVYGYYCFFFFEVLSDLLCDWILVEMYVVGVLLICIECVDMGGLVVCFVWFWDGEDIESVCVIVC